MILNLVENGPLIWPTVEENDETRKKKYKELSATEKLQADCDLKATNICLTLTTIILNTLLHSILNRHYQFFNKFTLLNNSHQCLAVPIFNQGDDPIACLNKSITFMSAVAASHFPLTNNQLRTSSNLRNQATIKDGRVTVQQVQGRQVKCTQPKRPRNAAWFKEKEMLAKAQESGQVLDEEQLAFLVDHGITYCHDVQPIIIHNATFQTDDLDTYDSDYDYISFAKAVVMANLINYGLDVLSEVPNFETYQNDMDNQSVQAMQHFEQILVDDYPDNEITNDSNIILYSQYLQETQQAAV
ncbi:hypothetical protein Tco_0070745 [Tanacetum coccineum]